MKSDLSGFYELTVEERLNKIKEMCSLTDEETEAIGKTGCLSLISSDRMIENVIGTLELPIGIATNFIINNRDVLIPMAIEEPSVVAGASNAAKLARPAGFTAKSTEPLMIGQIQLMDAPPGTKEKIYEAKDKIKNIANSKDSTLVKLGGGMKNLEVRELASPRGKITIVHIIVNVQDAMGANAVNTMCECIAPFLEELTGARAVLKIISNLAIYRLAKAEAIWKKEIIGEDTIEGILDAYALAQVDTFRCATHNKGIMNGVDAVMIVTGNDFRAAEAGAHAFASMDGYKPLTSYAKNSNGDLVGKIEIPMGVGIVGGAINSNPIAKIALKILGIKHANELGEIAACVGLASNFAALRAIVKEGIQRGHMKLHANNIALAAGANHEEAPKVTQEMLKENKISVAQASEILEKLRSKSKH